MVSNIDDWVLKKVITAWFCNRHMYQGRYGLIGRKEIRTLLSVDKVSIKLLVGVIMCHCIIGRMPE